MPAGSDVVVIVSGVACTVRVVLPVTPLNVAEMVSAGAYGRGEARAVDGGYARVRGSPRHLTRLCSACCRRSRSRWR